ncbi:MAG: endonuclease/exonuclease/phosphatase family protein [Muribaculaceae bacterium]|nr:endonuclease/exonuclease/phosphatase family protein [Muribaculaceae bacterium]
MNRLLTAVAALALAVIPALAQGNQAKSGNRMQVAGIAFYNLENLFDTIPNNPESRDLEYTPNGQKQWNGQKYWSKINNLARAISSFTSKTTPYGPAIIGVSEIENRSVLEDLVNNEQLRAWNLQVVHHDSPDARGVDVGLLYNPRYFKLENVTNHRLTEIKFRTRDQMCVVGSLMGQRIAVIVNHWPSRLGGQEQSSPNREAAARLCRAISDSLWKVDPNIGVVIMGDLNDDPQDPSCAKVLGAKRDRNVGPHEFYNPWWEKLDRGIGTLAYKSSWNLFDQIIISGNLANGEGSHWQYWRSEVLNRDFLKDTEGTRQGYPLRTFASGSYLNGYSDHFPTEVFLRRSVPARK